MNTVSTHSKRIGAIIRVMRIAVLVLPLSVLLPPTAYADFGPSEPDATAQMKSAERLVYKKKYSKAIKTLKNVTQSQPDNADAWNLLGFASRKTDQLGLARQAYEKALTANPDHKGALEYQGELFIRLGDIDAAKANLKKLETLCPSGCEELTLLAQALSQI